MSANHSAGKMCISFVVISLSLLISTSEGSFCYNFYKSEATSNENAIRELERTVRGRILEMETKKHEAQILTFRQQVERIENEHGKASKMVAECEESLSPLKKEKQKLSMKYESVVHEAQRRTAKLEESYKKLLEKSQQLEKTSNSRQQELTEERLINSQVRKEKEDLQIVHDKCEAQLAILEREKESLQLQMNEEDSKIANMTEEKIVLVETAKEATNLGRALREEIRLLANREDEIKSELREINQNQMDDMAKLKLKECQGQLDMARVISEAELQTKRLVMAECAAEKIRAIAERHQLELNWRKENCSEEKRSSDIRLAQESQKISMLGLRLNNLRASEKKHEFEQLQSAMRKQCTAMVKMISDRRETLSAYKRFSGDLNVDPETE